MIDQNKNIVLIDFDRMVSNDILINDTEHTADFSSAFAAPEFNSYSCDIYSLGMVIFYIMIEKVPTSNFFNKIEQYKEISDIFYQCIEEDPDKRPNISDLIKQYYEKFHSQIQDEDLLFLYKKSVYQRSNSDLSDELIRLHLRADDKNDSDAQFRLGVIYEQGKKTTRNISKSIHYYELASKQNNMKAQLNLAAYYYDKGDMENAISYLTPTANLNHVNSQLNLATIYFNKGDMEKAIHFYTLAANQGEPNAQLSLGILYYSDEFVPRDINKAIHYLSLASKNNICDAHFVLGTIFYESGIVPMTLIKQFIIFHWLQIKINHNLNIFLEQFTMKINTCNVILTRQFII